MSSGGYTKAVLWGLFGVEEYPEEVAENAMPQDTFYNYIAHTFLNGIINYVYPFATYLILREADKDVGQEEIDKVFQRVHTHLGRFRAEVVVLAKTDNSFWIFWYDPDVSDCGVGRCSNEAITINEFEKLVLDRVEELDGRVIRLPELKGWISF
jgi:hypothetical protein